MTGLDPSVPPVMEQWSLLPLVPFTDDSPQVSP